LVRLKVFSKINSPFPKKTDGTLTEIFCGSLSSAEKTFHLPFKGIILLVLLNPKKD